MSVLLKGITWSHSRGYTSITAVSQRFCELNPGVSIEWEKRSLQEFADAPIENLAKAYDLLIIEMCIRDSSRGMPIQNGLLPTPGWSLPHRGMQLSVLIQLIPRNPASAIRHA